ncbi:hypothetical protein GGER_47760 [Serratia rubidaea]
MATGFNKIALLTLALTLNANASATPLQCDDRGFTLQTLGSGGPITDDQRASSGEVIWINGKSAILIDAGGGVFYVSASQAHGWKISSLSA